MAPGLFAAVFGDVFEHTPAIAQRVHAGGLTTVDDGAEALHAKMVAAMRDLPEADRLVLLRAHPDLAGRLALARGLTPDSAREQGGAGLDRLTEAELQRFTALNEAYRDKFGIPFVIAVRGLGKDQILQAFEARLAHDRHAEVATALAEVERIALFRIRDRLALR